MSVDKKEEKPRVIHESFFNLIKICQDYIPFGEITLRIDHGHPVKILNWKPEIRLDKLESMPFLMVNEVLSQATETKEK